MRGFRARELREAEVQNLDSTIVREKKVFRFQVAMDDASFVGSRETAGDLQGVVNRLATGERAASQPVAQGFAFEKFGDNVGRALLVVADVEDGENARMIESGGGAGLLSETLQAIAIGGE